MNENFDPVTLILLLVAVAAVIYLRSIMGRRTGSERRPSDSYTTNEKRGPRPNEDQGYDNVVPMPNAGDGARPSAEDLKKEFESQLKTYAGEKTALRDGLTAIREKDNSFNLEEFVDGAKTAYEMIVMAFAEGNRDMLKNLLSEEVFKGFDAAIEQRESQDLIVDSQFVGIERAEYWDAQLRDSGEARVTLKFVSSIITATHNAAGDVVDGDPKKVQEVTDLWTFSRKVKSRDPNWRLVATEAAG